MTREIELQLLLSALENELNEALNNPELADLSAEEILELATEITLNGSVSTTPKKQLIASINKEHVEFCVDDQFRIPLYKDSIYDLEDE
jgi:hypothetical protein